MASNYGNKDRHLGSRLSDSTWRPSSGPYDATPKDNGGGGGGGLLNTNRSGPTPNSLNESAGHRAVHFSRAEYKAPNSLQNSLMEGNTNTTHSNNYASAAGSLRHHDHHDDVGSGEPPSAAVSSRAGRSSVGSGNSQSPYRESKSYVDRYRDVKRMTSLSPTRRGGDASRRSRSAGRSVSATRTLTSESNSSRRYFSPELRASYDDDNMSERTPLERWESRKERKLMEQRGGATHHNNNTNTRTVTPIRSSSSATSAHRDPSTPRDSTTRRMNEGAAREVARDRATRWSPREEDRYDYDEYDDSFGATSKKTSSPSPPSRDRSSDGYERHRERSSDRYNGKGGLTPSTRTSTSRSTSHERSNRYKEELRRYENDERQGQSQRQQRRREPSPSEFEGRRPDRSRHDNDDHGRMEGEGSPLFDDADEEGAGDIGLGDRSPLALNDHFDDDRELNRNRRAPRGLSAPTSSRRSNPQKSSSVEPSPRRSNNNNASTTPGRSSGGRKKKKSTYVDDLASFTESITSSVARSVSSQHDRPPPAVVRTHDGAGYGEMPVDNNNGGRQQQHHQQQQQTLMRSHDGAQYSEMRMEEGIVGNAEGMPVTQYDQGASPASTSHQSPSRGERAPAASHNNGQQQQPPQTNTNTPPPNTTQIRMSRDHGSITSQDVRVASDNHNRANPRRASEFCERFTGIRPCGRSHNSSRNRNKSSASSKAKKKYICITVIVCTLCIVAAGLAIYFIGEKQDEERKEGVRGSGPGRGEGGERGQGVGLDGWDGWVTTAEPSVSAAPTPGPSGAPTATPSETPTVRPTSERERSIGSFLSEVSDGESDRDGGPQHAAKMWIIHEDELELDLPQDVETPNDGWQSSVAERIQQRYALATLYHTMGIGNGGVVKGWLEGDECREVGDYGTAWDGVGCGDDGRVRALALDGANLHGSIPHELSLLTSIENLIIKNNPGLIGKIPHGIGNRMTQLRQLGLYGNNLTGSVPKNVFRLSNLVYLNLADNSLMGKIHWEEISHHQKNLHRLILHNNFLEGSIDFHQLAKSPSVNLLALSNNLFGGKIDDTVGSLANLEYLYLDGNKLAGSIPDGVGNLSKLKALNLDGNSLYGTLPDTIGDMHSLEHLSAKDNTISGGFPTSIQSLTNLQTLNLASNAMSGHLRHLSFMSSLKNVHLYSNSFTGSIDGSLFTNLPDLEVLFLSSNSLTGGIPTEVASAQKQLKGLYISDNKLNGNVPQEVCALYKLENLYLDANNFNGMLPKCLGNMSGLRRFYAFKNNFSGKVPSGMINLPHLVELGIEENDVRGGLDQTCTPVLEKGLNIWADCSELDGGCDCCERCCSDRDKSC